MRRNHITYDWEFIEDGKTIEPVSLGMRRDDGDMMYAVNIGLREAKLFENPWLVKNVWPHLPRISCEEKHGGKRVYCWTDKQGHLDREDPACRPLKQIARMAKDFIVASERPLLWAYYSAYDHVTLAQLWGPMSNLPEGVPMHTMDIKQEMVRLGLNSEDMPSQQGPQHNALADANHNMVMLQRLFEYQDGDPFNLNKES